MKFLGTIEKYLKNSKFFIDVGSQKGFYVDVAKKNMKEGLIYYFEPNDDRIDEKFVKEIKKKRKNITIKKFTCALSHINGKIKLYKDTIGSKVKPDRDSREVKTHTLDEILKGKELIPDTIKIDIEGGEYYMLRGAENLIKKGKTNFFIEVHDEYLRNENISVDDVLNLFDDNIYEKIILFLVDGLPKDTTSITNEELQLLKDNNKYESPIKPNGNWRKTRIIYYHIKPKL
jgi:FkbM family methyltransferase